MAINLKRRRGTVSYKEPSSDDDFSQSSDAEHTPRKKRATPQRRSTRHKEPESERTSPKQSRQHAVTTNTTSINQSPNVRLRGKRRVSYRESSEEDNSDADFEVQEVTPSRERQRASISRASRTKKDRKPKSRPMKPLGAPLKAKKAPEPTVTSRKVVSDGKIPAWATLPYHVLLQIFVYASHPLHDDNLTPTSSISWLTRTARICSAFTKPALTALYRNPPIFAIKQNRKELVQHLISSQSGSRADHSVMVKRLELDATRMSKLTDPQNSVTDLVALISSLKTLKEIDIFDPFDKPPYRERARILRRWYYPDELFAALGQTELCLRSWRWNSTYCAHGPIWMKDVHASRAFQSLREISLTKFHPKVSKTNEDSEPSTEELLGSALAVLPNLKALTFETCTVANGKLLPLLPNSLVSLNITNCRDLVSEALQAFLATHGGQLEELILNHNQCLDLSFFIDLKQSCPRLEVLRMDLHYYNTLSTSSDNEPLYDELLPEGQIPSWPATLRIIDLEFLRNWTPSAAVAFFTSLINAAEDLPWLREITITAIVDIDWRQRAEFRRKWTARFQKVFARKLTAPNPRLESLRAFREWKASGKEPNVEENDSSVIAVLKGATKSVAAEESDSDAPLLPHRSHRNDERWDSKRLRSRAKSSPNYEESSSDSDEDSSGNDSDSEKIGYVQGRCYVVDFKIDNSRPQEQIYDEEDFLDEEASGDEDWNGNDVVDDEYAW